MVTLCYSPIRSFMDAKIHVMFLSLKYHKCNNAILLVLRFFLHKVSTPYTPQVPRLKARRSIPNTKGELQCPCLFPFPRSHPCQPMGHNMLLIRHQDITNDMGQESKMSSATAVEGERVYACNHV